MDPVYKDDYPLYGRVDVPRMIVAQFDSIRHERIYKNIAPRVLKLYEKLITSSDMQNWFTIYLVTFLFLHQVSCISFDRYRRVRDNSGGRQQVCELNILVDEARRANCWLRRKPVMDRLGRVPILPLNLLRVLSSRRYNTVAWFFWPTGSTSSAPTSCAWTGIT